MSSKLLDLDRISGGTDWNMKVKSMIEDVDKVARQTASYKSS